MGCVPLSFPVRSDMECAWVKDLSPRSIVECIGHHISHMSAVAVTPALIMHHAAFNLDITNIYLLQSILLCDMGRVYLLSHQVECHVYYFDRKELLSIDKINWMVVKKVPGGVRYMHLSSCNTVH